jgi:hypothetical protein
VSDDKERFEVLLEEIKGQFQLIADGHKSLREDMAAGFSQVHQSLDSVDARVGRLEADVYRIKDHLELNGTAKRSRGKKTPRRKK